jgi:DNA mismatch repair protein MutS
MSDEPITIFDIVDLGIKLTPMMVQFHEVKKQYPDIIVLFRMGDFYEVFFEDAIKASKVLNIALTHRGKLGDYRIPMAGIPHHAANTYIDRLTSVGLKAAICEQVEDPKLAKGIVKRAVTQVVSPGMPYDLNKVGELDSKFIACGLKTGSSYFLCLIDYTTGHFFGLKTHDVNEFIEKLRLYSPQEFIGYLGQWENDEMITRYIELSQILHTNIDSDYFEEKYSSFYIEKIIPSYKRDEVIKLNPKVLSPIGALSFYICSTGEMETIEHIRPFKLENNEDKMKVTYSTLVGLEIFPKSKDYYKESILGYFDKTKCCLGARLLKNIFHSPLRDIKAIEARYDAIDFFIANPELHKKTRECLDNVRDIERILAKVSTKKANGSDLLNLAASIQAYEDLLIELKGLDKSFKGQIKKAQLKTLIELKDTIRNSISDEIGANLDKGNLIKLGASKKRDRLKKVSQNVSEELSKLEQNYRKESGISNLRIKSNNVAGYFIEVSKAHSAKVPVHYKRRQTLVNSERYLTEELTEFEKEIVSAKDKLYKLEKEIFDGIVQDVSILSNIVFDLSQALAMIDIIQSFAWISFQEDLVRPTLKNEKIIKIKGGFHPLIKSNLKDEFVAHNITLDKDQHFALITGPNMAGKTTVMREVAIIQFLAQIGCFVPAQSAELGIRDFLFSRLGAHDDIIKGQSTFMVEMSETAEILRHASPDSLILLDEIGRGTSTYDGLSIAWSLVEHFVKDIKSLTLFSTHYHELIELTDSLANAKNLTVKTHNKDGDVHFMYELIEAGATQSFGIHVAQLAGLPKSVLKRSSQILKKLEKNKQNGDKILSKIADISQTDMFDFPVDDESNSELEEIKGLLEEIDLFNSTPLQVVNKLDELKTKFLN